MADPLDNEESTIDNTILESLREISEREGIGDKQEETKTAATVKPAAESAETRTRDENGKFAKQESAPAQPATEPPPQSTDKPAQEADQPLLTTTGQPIDINRAPASWKPAAKAQWSNLTPEVRSEIYRREGDFLNGNKGIQEVANFGKSVQATIEPYRMLIEAEGGTPETAIRDTMKTAALFRVGTPQQKMQALFDLDARFNVGLRGYFEQQLQARMQQGGQTQQPQGQLPQPQFIDPRVDQILASLQTQERERAAQTERVSNQAIEQFIAANDEHGQPVYPFVNNVLDDMAMRVTVIRRANPSMAHQDILKQAYDAAVWANPETRAVLIGQQQAKATTAEANLQKVESAKRASGLNMPRRGALPAGEALGTMDNTIKETYRQLTG